MVFGSASVVCKVIAKIVDNWAKLMPKSFIIRQKSIPNRPKWCPGALRKRPWEQVGSRNSILEHHRRFGGGILSPLGWCWAPFWTPLGAKVIPKSNILAPGSIKSRKIDVQEGVMEKAWKFYGMLIGKWKRGRCKTIDFSFLFNSIVLSALFVKRKWKNNRKLLPKLNCLAMAKHWNRRKAAVIAVF